MHKNIPAVLILGLPNDGLHIVERSLGSTDHVDIRSVDAGRDMMCTF